MDQRWKRLSFYNLTTTRVVSLIQLQILKIYIRKSLKLASIITFINIHS